MTASRRSGTTRLERFVVGPLETNCYLFYEDRSRAGVLIDPGSYTDLIPDFIRTNRIGVTGTINTHSHADHVSADAFFAYPVMIHALDAPYLKEIKPSRLLQDGDVIEMGESRIRVIHTPGHTPGGICLLCDDVLFSGDTLFLECVGRADFSYGDAGALARSIRDKLFTLPDDVRVFPGHGPDTTIGHEKRFNRYV